MNQDAPLTEPVLYLISRPHLDLEALADFLADEGVTWHRTPDATPPEEIVETAGRICYMSYGKLQSPRSNAAYIRNLIAQGHDSVLEHVSWTFILTNVSRAFTHQLVRHRIGFSYSQLSQQYHEESDAEFVMPPLLENSPAAKAIWRTAMETARQSYQELITELEGSSAAEGMQLSNAELRRAVRSAARSVMPNATATKIVFTANARALRHFLTVRGNIPGDEEMRRVAAKILTLLQAEGTALFADFHIDLLPDGSPIVLRTDIEGKQNGGG